MSKAKEVADTFDSIAELINQWNRARETLIVLEDEVFCLSQQLIGLRTGQANQFKARLWEIWNLEQ